MTSSYPLDDVRVVDLSSGISGAYCTKLLADAGADVVKVEGPDGDPFRDEAALFAVLHTSKRSAMFDPACDDDRDALDRLVRDADIVVAGHPREVREWLGRDVEELRQELPELVVVSISWFGGSRPVVGPARDRVHAAGLVRIDRQPRAQARAAGRHRGPHRRMGRGIGRRRRRAGRAARRAPERGRARSSTSRRSRR